MVWRIDEQKGAPGCFFQRGGFAEGHPGVPGGVERRSPTLRLDRHGGLDSGKALPLPPDPGTNSTWLHPTPQPKEEKSIVQLIPGRYTRSQNENSQKSEARSQNEDKPSSSFCFLLLASGFSLLTSDF